MAHSSANREVAFSNYVRTGVYDLNIEIDPKFETLENSLRQVYEYDDVYVEQRIKSKWYVPCIGVDTKPDTNITDFMNFAKQVINDYPKTRLSRDGFKETTLLSRNIKHPVTLLIWNEDVDSINLKASELSGQ